MIVIDASSILEIVLQTKAARTVESHVFTGGTLHAPHLLDLEVAQVLRRYERVGTLTAQRAGEALEDFAGFRIERYPHSLFMPRIWALRHNVTTCDACYLALAEALDAPLLTMDRRLLSVPGHDASVVIPGDDA